MSESTDVSSVLASSDLAPSARMLKHIDAEEIPASEDLHSTDSLRSYLTSQNVGLSSIVGVGDVMLSGRMRGPIEEFGDAYPFAAVQPLLDLAPVGFANLEGPLARVAKKLSRPHSYKVAPERASAMKSAGINLVTLANNHLLDCGREGVIETLDALSAAKIGVVGGGAYEQEARRPGIVVAGTVTIGVLGYYWNRRTAATEHLPGSAMDTEQNVRQDIAALRDRVDRVVVGVHWGIPYDHQPSAADRMKARFFVDSGADAVLGHHPHVVQPVEIYRGRPIFYSLGNFVFGSGNSKGESLLVSLTFENTRTIVRAFPLYVKNRDPRVNYQPKALRGGAAAHALRRLADISGELGQVGAIDRDFVVWDLPRSH